MLRRKWTTAAVVATLTAGASLAGAFNPQPDPPKGFGMIGMVEGQTLRLNAVNIAVGNPDEREGRCLVSLGFADLAGQALGEVADFELRPGEGVFADLSARDIPSPDDAGRTQVRPVARTVGNPNCLPVVTVELFGPEGAQTEVYIGDPSDG